MEQVKYNKYDMDNSNSIKSQIEYILKEYQEGGKPLETYVCYAIGELLTHLQTVAKYEGSKTVTQAHFWGTRANQELEEYSLEDK